MKQEQDIIFGLASQTLWLDAPEGRPSSITSVAVYEASTGDTGTAESATTGAASVETNPNTTMDAAGGATETDPTLVPLTATTGATVGRRYLLTAVNGFKEWVEVEAVSSGVSVKVRHPLQGEYASADTFASTRMSITVDSTWVADTSNLSSGGASSPRYRVRWVYVVSGVTYVRDAYFDLVRYVGDHNVDPLDVDRLAPGWLDRLPVDYRDDQGRALIDDAYAAVKLDLAANDVNDAMVSDQAIVDELVRRKVVATSELTRFYASGDRQAQMEAARLDYSSTLDAFVRVVRRVPSRDSTGAGFVGVSTQTLVR
jgi:hypothetical protein